MRRGDKERRRTEEMKRGGVEFEESWFWRCGFWQSRPYAVAKRYFVPPPR